LGKLCGLTAKVMKIVLRVLVVLVVLEVLAVPAVFKVLINNELIHGRRL